MYDWRTDHTFILLSEYATLHLTGQEKSQNIWYWSTKNPTLIQKMPLHNIKNGVWSAASATRTTGPTFLPRL